jgi:hypothetical protein
MRVEWRLFAGAGVFFTITGTIYWFASYEDAGTVLLGLAVAAVLMVAGWLLFQARRVGMRPEDRADATVADGAGEVDYFPSSSVWPLVVAAGAVVCANALAFGIWLGVGGVLLLLAGVVGYAYEASSKA